MASTTPITNTSFFRPTGISGCALWLDAADSATVIRTGSAVTRWNDKSGSNINMVYDVGNVTYNTTGFNGSPTITFGPGRSGLTYNSNLNLTYTNSLSFYLVLRPTTPSGNIRVLSFFAGGVDYTPPGFGISIVNTTPPLLQVGVGRGTPYLSFNPLNVSNTNILTSVIFNGNLSNNPAVPLSNTGIGINGNTFANFTGYSIGTNFSTYNPFRIGEWSGSAGDIFNGNISEILMYNRALNATENQQVEGYLAWKWGLQRSLPANHPYYTNPQQSTYPYTLLRTIPQPQTSLPSWSFFSPRSIPSCSLWLDAADTTSFQFTSGVNISNWNDKSGNGRNFTLVGSTSPVLLSNIQNGNSVVNFNGTNQRLSNANFVFPNSAYTVFSLQLLRNTVGNQSGYQRLVSTDGYFFIGAVNCNVAVFTGVGAVWNDINALTPSFNNSNQWALISTYSAPSGSSNALFNFINGTQYNTKNGTTSNFTGLTVGGWTATQQLWSGYLAEFLVYSRVLSAGERQQVEGYIALKWGLQPTLPAAHPTKANFLYPIFPALPAVTQSVAPAPINPNGRFTPTSLSGLALWLDAADAETISPPSGGTASAWLDKSGNGKNATFVGTNTYNPVNKMIYTSGTSYFFSAVDIRKTTVPNITLFLVHRQRNNTTPTTQGLWGQDIGSGWNRFQLLNFSGLAYSLSIGGGSVRTISELNTLNTVLYTCRFSRNTANDSLVNVNGRNSVRFTELAASSQTTTQNIYFGTIDTSVKGVVEFYEIILYTTSLTISQTQQVEGYLAWKWGLRSSLPSTHPNAFMPP